MAALRKDTPMTLSPEEVARLRSLHDRLDMAEVRRFICRFRAAVALCLCHAASWSRQQAFLGTEDTKMPYIIGVAGSVAVGKSTTARVLQALLARWPDTPKVDLVTTDAFFIRTPCSSAKA